MTIEVRIAQTETERAAVYRLRYEVFVADRGLFQREADSRRRWLADGDDADSRILIAVDNGEAVGTMRVRLGKDKTFSHECRDAYDMARFRGVICEREIMVVSRFLVLPRYRGGDLALQLIKRSFELAAAEGVALILGRCEAHLVNHYRKLGYRPFGALRNHEGNGLLTPFAVVTGDFEYLRRINSPVRETLRGCAMQGDSVPRILAALEADLSILSEEVMGAEPYFHALIGRLGSSFDRDVGLNSLLADPDIARILLARGHILACKQGHALFREGHASRTIYILLSGSLLLRGGDGSEERLATPGALVGEDSFFSGQRRLNDAVVGPGGASVAALNDRALKGIIAGSHSVSALFLHCVARALSRRLAGGQKRPIGKLGDSPRIAPLSRPTRRRRWAGLTTGKLAAPVRLWRRALVSAGLC